MSLGTWCAGIYGLGFLGFRVQGCWVGALRFRVWGFGVRCSEHRDVILPFEPKRSTLRNPQTQAEHPKPQI